MPTARKRAYHHGDLRAALIDAAAKLIRERGVAEFSLREAARAVGVDPAACYRHFRDREAVLLALAQEGFVALAASMVQASAGARGTRGKLLAIANSYLSFALERPAQFRLMFGDSGVPSRDPRMRTVGVDRGPYDRLVELAAAYPGAPADVEGFANALWAVAHGVTRLVIDGAIAMSEPDARALLDRALRAMLDGIATR
jgi:AcrR family transcriptional regulator